MTQGDVNRAAALGDQALTAYRDADDQNGVALSLILLGAVASDRGEHEQAMAHLEEVLTLSRAIGDGEVAMSLHNLGFLVSRRGDLDRAAQLSREALETWQRLGESEPQVFPLNLLGGVASLQGEHDQAVKLLTEALALAQAQRDDTRVAMTLGNLGDALRRRGDHGPALNALAETLQLYGTIGDPIGTALVLNGFALLIAPQQPELAARLFGLVDAQLRQFGSPLPPPERAENILAVEQLQAVLDEDAFAVAWAAGQALPLQEAVAEALSLADELDVDDRQEGPAHQG